MRSGASDADTSRPKRVRLLCRRATFDNQTEEKRVTFRPIGMMDLPDDRDAHSLRLGDKVRCSAVRLLVTELHGPPASRAAIASVDLEVAK